MKRTIIKTLSLCVAIILTLLTLFSCTPTYSGEQNSGNNNTNGGSTGTSHYYGVKTVYSYEEVMDALAIVRQRYDAKPTYTVKDMGEDYTIFYQFVEYHYNRPYPIDYDVFFTSQSSGNFNTVIFFENQTCSSEKHSGWHGTDLLHIYKEDEDYDKLKSCYKQKKACVEIRSYYRGDAVEIENTPTVYGGSFSDQYEHYRYHIFYGMEIMQLWSCVELDDEFFDVFFANLVTTSEG